jgi:hypothetical protein
MWLLGVIAKRMAIDINILTKKDLVDYGKYDTGK